jgi:hypothetical protein
MRSLRDGHHVSHKEQIRQHQSPDEAARDVGVSFWSTHAKPRERGLSVNGTTDAFNRCLSDATKPEYVPGCGDCPSQKSRGDSLGQWTQAHRSIRFLLQLRRIIANHLARTIAVIYDEYIVIYCFC